MKGLAIFFLLVLFIKPIIAQQHIEGVVLDSTQKAPLYLANVTLHNDKDSLVNATVTDEKGQFLLKSVRAGKYNLKISFVGFKSHSQLLEVKNKKLTLDNIFLAEDLTQLDEVTVESTAPPVVVKQDTIEFNSAAFKTTSEANLEELIKKLPGLEIKDGKVTIQGQPITKIIVDGKPFFQSDQNFTLKNLPADLVNKIQVIDEKSKEAQFSGHDDGERNKVINVVTKPEKRRGYFGNTNVVYSHPKRYVANANINFLKGKERFSVTGRHDNLGSGTGGQSISMVGGAAMPVMISEYGGGSGGISKSSRIGGYYFSEIDKKLEFHIDYSYRQSERQVENSISRQFIQSSDEGRIYNEDTKKESSSYGHNVSLNLGYKFSESSNLIVQQGFSLSHQLSNSELSGATLQGNEEINSTENNNYSESDSKSWNGMFFFQQRLGKKGRTISLMNQLSFSNQSGMDSVLSINRFNSGNVNEQYFDQITNPNSNSQSFSNSITYTEPLGEKKSLKLSYSRSSSKNESDRRLLNLNQENQEYEQLDTLRSSDYVNHNIKNRFTSSLQLPIGKMRMSASVGYEMQLVKNDQELPFESFTSKRFRGFAPSVSLSYSEKGKGQIRFSLSRSMSVPNATQLQSTVNNKNPLFLSRGNPDLDQSFRNNMQFTYTMMGEKSKGYLSFRLSGSVTENQIVNRTIVGNGNNSPEGIDLPIGARFTTPTNLDGQKSISLSIGGSKPLEKLKLNLNSSLSYSYNRNPQFLNEIVQIANRHNYGFSAGVSSNFNEKLDLSLSARPSYSVVQNSNPEEESYRYGGISAALRTTWLFGNGFSLISSIGYNKSGSVRGIEANDQLLWNMSVSRKFFKSKLDFRISANDLLKQNVMVDRNVTSEYIQNSETNVLRQIIRLSLTYKFNRMGGGNKNQP